MSEVDENAWGKMSNHAAERPFLGGPIGLQMRQRSG
jgi:hypothetical protein